MRRLLVSGTILLLPVAVLAGAWRLGGVSALEDDLIYYLPIRQYIAERIHAGEFPLWNPLVSMGTSLAADPQSGLWYLPTYLFVLLPPLVAYPVSLVLHFTLAGGGMYRFLRACRRDWRAALLGAVAFEFCGFMVAHRAHLTIHHAVAWLPWMLYGWQRFAVCGRMRYAVLASAAFGAQLLVQHVQISIISAALVTAYVYVVLWRRRAQTPAPPADAAAIAHAQDRRAAQLWWIYPAGMTIGAMLASIQLVPTWQQYAGSVRGAPSYYLFNENSWLPTSAPLLVFPMLQGARTPNAIWDTPWWGPSHFCEQSAYGTILILILAVASLRLLRWPRRDGLCIGSDTVKSDWTFLEATGPRVRRHLLTAPVFPGQAEARVLAGPTFRRKMWVSTCECLADAWHHVRYECNREVLFWWSACIIALLIALGDLTPLGKLLFHVPVYRSLRVPARWILVWSTAMPVLASLVVSTLLRRPECVRGIARAVQFTVTRVLPAAVAVCLLLLFVAARHADHIAAAFPTASAEPKLAGLIMATRLSNIAILWPLLVMIATGWTLLRWVRAPGRGNLVLMVGVFLLDLVSVAGFVDVDTRTYTRRDLIDSPPLAQAIRELGARPGERLLVPRLESDYERPLEVLWPQSNLRYDVATFNGYGPLGSLGARMLFRFMPWGSSEEMLGLLRNDALLRAMGVRFIATRSAQERALLQAAMLPDEPKQPAIPVAGSEAVRPVRYGQDVAWGPVAIPAPGIYEIAFDVVPIPRTASRWFLRLERDGQKQEVGKTRTIDPADMTTGPRRMRFVYYFAEAYPAITIRVKSELGEALSAGHATVRQLAVGAISNRDTLTGAEMTGGTGATAVSARFVARNELPDGVTLHEVPGAQPLLYWAGEVETVSTLTQAVDHLECQRADSRAAARTIVEQPTDAAPIPAADDAQVRFTRPVAHELRASARSSTGGLLIFNESFAPGWVARIDGQSAQVLRVNAVCQGIRVPAGEHEIRFTYAPPGLRTGGALSALSLAILLGWLVLTWRSRQPLSRSVELS